MLRSRIVLSGALAGIAIAGASTFLLAPSPEPAMLAPSPDPVRAKAFGVESVPDFYQGTFQWDGSSNVQRVALDVQEVSNQDLGHRKAAGTTIVATGRGTYTTTRDTHFTFRIEVDPRTGAFTMVESEPSTDDFVTAGFHTGEVGASLETIQARWQGHDGMTGTLTLHAVNTSMRPEPATIEPAREYVNGSPAPVAVAASEAPDTALSLERGVRLQYLAKAPRVNDARCVQDLTDRVEVHYAGWSADGLFDSSYHRDRTLTFPANRLIDGWQIALPQTCVGDTVRVWIPAAAAYGHKGAGVPTGDLLFDIELLGVIRGAHSTE
jgi:hypothetical protein